MTRPTRLLTRRTAAAASLAAVLALSACGGGQVRSGAAALVGDQRLSTADLGDTVTAALAAPGVAQEITSDVPGYQRSVLSEFITVEIVEEAARRAGVELDQAAVDAEYAALVEQVGGEEALAEQAAMAGLDDERVRAIARNRALTEALADALVPAGGVDRAELQAAYDAGEYDQVRVAVVVLPSLAEAQALLPEAAAADPEAFAALATARSIDQASGAEGGDLGLQPRSAFEQAGQVALGEQAFAAAPGATFVTEVPQGGAVVRVLARETTTLQEATPELVAQLQQPERDAAVEAAVREAAADLDITVNPRFGRWDAEALQVVDGDDRELSRGAGEAAPQDDPLGGLVPQQQ